jgi:hypothetical protein
VTTQVVPKDALSYGAGYLFHAPLLTAIPAMTVSGSKFTDPWTGWTLLGVTREGSELTYEMTTENVEAAEYLDPLAVVTTGRTASVSMDVMQVHLTNLRKALNADTTARTVSGSAGTTLTTLSPPAIGSASEVRCMIGWEASDETERWVAEQAFQVGTITIARRKGANNASIPMEFRFEVAPSGFPVRFYSAGTART